MKSISNAKFYKTILEVVPLPSEDNLCKWYIDNLLKEVKQLDLECLFLHAGETVCSEVVG